MLCDLVEDYAVPIFILVPGLTAALLRGDRVELRRLGTFSVRKHDARIGRNPRTGESVAVGEKHAFSSGSPNSFTTGCKGN